MSPPRYSTSPVPLTPDEAVYSCFPLQNIFSRVPQSPSNVECPIIGILSHPGDGAKKKYTDNPKASHIRASYVKFVESAGARVIPLIYNEPRKDLDKKLGMINGVVLTGGWRKSGNYLDVVQYIFKYALRQNKAGNHFPVLAICLGFELLTMIVSEDKNILENFSATNQASTLRFMSNEIIKGTLFDSFPSKLRDKLRTTKLVMQNHSYGISPAKFNKSKKLCGFFKILTTSQDADSRVYVSTVQAHKYPVIGLQWHPEKNAFEWGLSDIPHTKDAIQGSHLVATYFVREARRSKNRLTSSSDVVDKLICNHWIASAGMGDQVYIFLKK